MNQTQTPTVSLVPSVFARTMGATLLAASSDPYKTALHVVAVTNTGTCTEMAATDGYRLNRIRIPNNAPASVTALIGKNDAATMVKMAKEYAKTGRDANGPAFTVEMDTETMTYRATAGDTIKNGPLSSATFPTYAALFPTETLSEVGAYFDAEFLAAIGKTATALWPKGKRGDNYPPARVRLTNTHPQKPAVWEITTPDGIEAHVLLMPQRP